MKAFFNSSAMGYGLLWWADADNLSQFDDFAVTASDQPPGSPPALSGLSPASGRPGATFTLIGSSFGAVQGSSTVRLNGMAGTILSWSSSHIVTTIPSGWAGGPVAVQVIVAGMASNLQMFQVIPNCTYTLSPPGATLPAGGGTTLFTVTTPTGCAISPVHNADWVSVSVSGRIVTVQIAANADRTARSATVTVGTAAFVGTQDGDLVVPDEPTSSTAIYYHTDAIGSVRLTTDQTGQKVARYDFAPFGEGPTATTEPRLFAGGERDSGTNFDYLGARYFSAGIGRFTRPDDAVFSDPENPQSWNQYTYALNNPLRYVDPTGHDPCPAGTPEGTFCTSVTATAPLDAWALSQSFFAESFARFDAQMTARNFANFSAGVGDALTGRMIPGVNTSLTEYVRNRLGSDSVVAKDSLTYRAGDLTGGTVGWALAGSASATAAAIANGKRGLLFGRGTETLFNSSKVRFGWGWDATVSPPRDVIRLGIGPARGTDWWSHIRFWYP